MNGKNTGRLTLLAVYLVAVGAGYWGSTFCDCGILAASAAAVAVTVVILFAGSMVFNNTSVFDPYWSVAPPLMIIFYVAGILQSPDVLHHASGIPFLVFMTPRILVVFLLVLTYSARLTWNFLRGWPGLSHEDWRYDGFRKKTGKAYWPVSFSALHLFPSLMVFGGTLSLWVVVVQGYRPVNFMDIAAILVTGNAILLEAVADRQLRNFNLENSGTGKTMDKGLWSLSRHPNYLGEILFWWGLYLFALAANPAFWWVAAGPAAITLMFIFASIPMIEKRMLERRKDYGVYMKKVSMLLPWRISSGRDND
jgi:steroid 5-alpha reductase family enzyme